MRVQQHQILLLQQQQPVSAKVFVQVLSKVLDQRRNSPEYYGGGRRLSEKQEIFFFFIIIKEDQRSNVDTKYQPSDQYPSQSHRHTGDLRQQYDHQIPTAFFVLETLALTLRVQLRPCPPGNLDDFWGFRNDNFGDNGGRSVGFNGETTMLYNNEDMIGSTLMTTTTTSNVGAVATMKHDSTDNISDLWSLPWQLIEDSGGNNNYNNMVVGFDLDSATDNWHDFFHSI
ncbi:hypothetical protein F3Y22_tig00110893pilonHSYRG00942 [Hibiscus syriacus]|uniref:Uncharacterized protein n=1 Tax=Hibiscus syriacus TaxID=106335 RepID=A0A6A2ZHJ6_HIBSY|nr:hypothetical protein F3Y22_tig00110893pilonHSYRG00942 [Hibiscus syriacus]